MGNPIVRNVTPVFRNETKNNKHILTLSGTIANLSFLDDTISAKAVKDSLDNVKEDIVIRLNSGGGDVFEGIEIYNYLKSLSNHITIEVTALAASAASLVAMAGDKIIIRTGANMMVHEASTMAFGNKSDIQKTLNALTAIDTSIVDIYHDRTGLDRDEIDNLIANETWLTADEAINKGFADEKSSRKSVEKQKEGVENLKDTKYVAMLKQQLQTITAMIDEAEEDPKEPSSGDSLEQRVADVENDIKNIKSRLDKLEKGEGGEGEEEKKEPAPPQNNKFKRFAF
ncbi:Clp protease ClpP [Staphylococcus haemolyticus]|uniref:head maturation protease, ClpP-related n=1 Tax=Staphylococcus haemolyticus TaxID=1283 RepID=UPI0011A03D78|nr:head maturation protease, ClpP-related [Staphylococcus haemolyticus]MCK6069066.1 Clp protease ClpP [Staphylococcus haemolyticus]MCK6111063.1 Clp protease ClpP [Staphylococcus haemolyticus]MCK6168572.1 Clp protease ClpP [Staphylococcus haemolyticus]